MMSAYTAVRLVALYDRWYSDMGNWRNRFEEISQYVLPQQRSFISKPSPGDRRGEHKVYDSTALEANERLATRMHEALTSPASIWFRTEFEDEKLNKNDGYRTWMEDCDRKMRIALSKSNFDMVMGQCYLDLGALGTAIVCAEEAQKLYPGQNEWPGLCFRNIHLGTVGLQENANGDVDHVFYKMEMTADQIEQRFGTKAPEKVKKAMMEGKPDALFPILLCWFPRKLTKKPEGNLLPTERPWAEVWVDYAGKQLIEDDGAYEKSVFTIRWRKKSGDIPGYGPGERALPTIRTLNEAERLELAAWGKVIDPPMKTTSNNVVGSLDMKAAGMTTVRRMDETEPWELRPDLNHHMIQTEDKRYQIREIFRYHSLELPPREQVGEMTAYEVAKRVEQVYRALGPTVVQTKADLLNYLLQRVFGIMLRANQFLPVPKGLEGTQWTVTYVGAMALAQRAVEIEAIDGAVADALAIAQSTGKEDALDLIDMDAAQRYKMNIKGVPFQVIRSEDQVKERRDARAAANAAAAAQQQALAQSEAMKNMGQAVGQERVGQAIDQVAEQAL